MYKTITANIMVKNVQDTIEFYESKLGFQRTLTVPDSSEKLDFAILQKDDISIMFQEQQNLLEEYPTLANKDITPTFTLFITVDNVKVIYEEIKDKVRIAVDLHQTFYGHEEFAVFDNNGNILTIAQ
ncbi:MAG: VOC family protein [Bacilli bacterium]|nr:VOC family protein [Bacilli bacterium]